jgi:hypothetical protein
MPGDFLLARIIAVAIEGVGLPRYRTEMAGDQRIAVRPGYRSGQSMSSYDPRRRPQNIAAPPHMVLRHSSHCSLPAAGARNGEPAFPTNSCISSPIPGRQRSRRPATARTTERTPTTPPRGIPGFIPGRGHGTLSPGWSLAIAKFKSGSERRSGYLRVTFWLTAGA